MITIELLKHHPETIPQLVQLWHEGIGKTWLPDICISRVADKLHTHLNESTFPITWVALDNTQPVGMVSLRDNDGIRPDLTPWLGSLVVDPKYRKQGIGQRLIETTQLKAREFGFNILYLLAFDPSIPDYYRKLGWSTIGMDELIGHPVTVMEICL